MWKLALIPFLIALTFEQSEATCGQCNTNRGVACVSKTEFQICVENKPVPTQTFTCPNANEVCTNLGLVCAPVSSGSSITAACGGATVSDCGSCAGKSDLQFTCTTRNTFAKCTGGVLSKETGVCPVGRLCDISSPDTPCKEECLVQSVCDV